MFEFHKPVSVIPAFCLGIIHGKPLTQIPHLVLRETGIFFENILIRHGIFRKHVEGRMGTILFHRKDARHIGQCNIGLILQKITQKIKVLSLHCLRLLLFTHHAVPFVDQKDICSAGFHINLLQDNGKIRFFLREKRSVFLADLSYHHLLQIVRHFLFLRSA